MFRPMNKPRAVHRCEACGATQPRWTGRCPACGEWGTLREELVDRRPGGAGPNLGPAAAPAAVALSEVDPEGHKPMPTGLGEVDRVLAGGLLPGSSTLVGGEPGTGKSTLLLQVLASMASAGRRCLLVAAEEAAHQVRRRASRLGADAERVLVVEATDLGAAEAVMVQVAPDVVVVDSVQAVRDPEVASAAGSPAQVRACAQRLVDLAKATGSALVLVGHVTKDGSLAGPRALEHLVDTVLTFEGDRYSTLRALRSVKHRFGQTGETGLFEMGEAGLGEVPDPSNLFLGDRKAGVPGSAVTVPVEGHRALLVEVQALVGRPTQVPRRYVTGLDAGRVGFLVAVLDRWGGVPVGEHDVYVSVAGGARACEPAADLAICLALASCLSKVAVPTGIVAIGEVGLGGEVRRVSAGAKRLAEAGRLGFTKALVPARSAPGAQTGLQVRPVATLYEALSSALPGAAFKRGPDGAPRRQQVSTRRDRWAAPSGAPHGYPVPSSGHPARLRVLGPPSP
jgi:DNA repair protein RadA/Sms